MIKKERILFRRRHVSLVLQEAALLPNLTVEENLALPVVMDTGRLVEEEKAGKDLKGSGSCRGEEPVTRRSFPAESGSGPCLAGRSFLRRRSSWRTSPAPGWDRRQSLETVGMPETVRRALGAYGADGNP